MPAPHPPEFRRRAVELARERAKPISEIAADIGISESCLRNWMGQADIDEGKREGLTTEERAELTRLRRENLWVPETCPRARGGVGRVSRGAAGARSGVSR
jgi:transposase